MEAGRLRRNEEADLHDADGGSAHGSGLQSPWIPGGSCGLLHAGLAGAPASCIEERHVTSTGPRSACPAGACDPLGGCLTHSLPPPDRRHPPTFITVGAGGQRRAGCPHRSGVPRRRGSTGFASRWLRFSAVTVCPGAARRSWQRFVLRALVPACVVSAAVSGVLPRGGPGGTVVAMAAVAAVHDEIEDDENRDQHDPCGRHRYLTCAQEWVTFDFVRPRWRRAHESRMRRA